MEWGLRSLWKTTAATEGGEVERQRLSSIIASMMGVPIGGGATGSIKKTVLFPTITLRTLRRAPTFGVGELTEAEMMSVGRASDRDGTEDTLHGCDGRVDRGFHRMAIDLGSHTDAAMADQVGDLLERHALGGEDRDRAVA
jgi:hypothetical protein